MIKHNHLIYQAKIKDNADIFNYTEKEFSKFFDDLLNEIDMEGFNRTSFKI